MLRDYAMTSTSTFATLMAIALAASTEYTPDLDQAPTLSPNGPPLKKGGVGPKRSGPKVGDHAPDFELKLLGDKATFKLSDNFGKRPTVLIFHSFT